MDPTGKDLLVASAGYIAMPILLFESFKLAVN